MKNYKKIKFILEQLEKKVLKEDNYDSGEVELLDKHYPNHLFEHFREELDKLCRKYAMKGLQPEEMTHILDEYGGWTHELISGMNN